MGTQGRQDPGEAERALANLQRRNQSILDSAGEDIYGLDAEGDTTGNVRADDRVALFLLDQARRKRLKVYARVEIRELDDELSEALVDPD